MKSPGTTVVKTADLNGYCNECFVQDSRLKSLYYRAVLYVVRCVSTRGLFVMTSSVNKNCVTLGCPCAHNFTLAHLVNVIKVTTTGTQSPCSVTLLTAAR